MKIKETMRNQLIGRVLAMVMVLCLIFSMAITASAATVNQAVTDAKNGVVQIQVWFVDPEAAIESPLHYGTGFLVNDTTVVTCQHVATGFPDSWYVEWAKATNAAYGINRTATQVKENLELRIMLYRGTYIKATLTNSNPELDLAILTLNQTIDRTPLKIRDCDALSQTEEAFAIGFPAEMNGLLDKQTYDINDITITSGNINKIADMTFYAYDENNNAYKTYDSVNCVESSALISGGNSGGPLVDSDGNVIGVNAAGDGTRNLAVSSKELITYLSQLNVEFVKDGETSISTPGSNESSSDSGTTILDLSELSSLIAKAEALDTLDYSEASYAAVRDALKGANAALTAETQEEIDSAAIALKNAINALEEPESSLNQYVLIGVIAFVVVVIVVVVIVLVVVIGKKKSAPAVSTTPASSATTVTSAAQVAPTPTPVAPAPARVVPPTPAASETTVLSQGAGETTVLSQGAGETTVLSQAVNGGSLVRSSNNERIPINSADFTIGRERTKVDYCVGGNTNISRVHARFVVRDGVTYIVDNKAANGTFVNGVKARAGQEIELKDGDKILLADEKFEFNK